MPFELQEGLDELFIGDLGLRGWGPSQRDPFPTSAPVPALDLVHHEPDAVTRAPSSSSLPPDTLLIATTITLIVPASYHEVMASDSQVPRSKLEEQATAKVGRDFESRVTKGLGF